MRIALLVLAIGVVGAAAWQHLRYLDARREAAQDDQPVIYGGDTFHLVVFLRTDEDSDDVVLEALRKKADAPVDLSQLLLAVNVVAVLRAVAVAGGPGHDLDHLGPLHAAQVANLVLQATQALGRDVVLRARRK